MSTFIQLETECLDLAQCVSVRQDDDFELTFEWPQGTLVVSIVSLEYRWKFNSHNQNSTQGTVDLIDMSRLNLFARIFLSKIKH